MSRRKTHEEFIEELKIINPNITILGTYINNKTKICCCCKNEHIWYSRPDHLLNGSGCPICYKDENEKRTNMKKQCKNISYIGIYCIKNKIDNKVYIGQSVDINKRFIKHKTLLNNNKHNNRHLQRSWNKYGENEFDFYIVELCKKDSLNDREKYWIKHFNSTNPQNGYNIAIGGAANKGFHHTKESIEKMLSSRGYNGNYIVQTDLNNRFLAMWENPNVAAKVLGIDVRGIYNCIKHKNNVSKIKNSIWFYLNEYLNIQSSN